MTELNDHRGRAHALLSASSSARWLACPPSAVAAEAYPQQDTEFTREGTLAHEVAEAVARERLNGQDFAPAQWEAGVTAEMLECAKGYADYIQEQLKSNDAIVLLEQRVDFSPWVPDGFGTCDCIILQGDTMVIIDYKYGVGVAVSATENSQLMLYALGALNDYGIACDVAKVEMHIYQPRINNVSQWAAKVEDLALWSEQTVRPIAGQAVKGEGEYREGDHCRFCPHAGRCQRLTTACVEFVETHDLHVAVPVLAPWQVAEVLRLEPLVTLWLKKVKTQALTTLLDGGEVPGYKVVEGKLGNRKWTDELQVAETLRSAGYDLNDIAELKLFTPAAMDKSIGKQKVAELLDGFIERSPGAPTVVPETDKRPVYDRAAEFEKLED